jgi:hypothetical protein
MSKLPPPNIPNANFLFRFVLEQAADKPLSVRIQVYRATAELMGSDIPAARELYKLANDLEQSEKNVRQFVFSFSSQ